MKSLFPSKVVFRKTGKVDRMLSRNLIVPHCRILGETRARGLTDIPSSSSSKNFRLLIVVPSVSKVQGPRSKGGRPEPARLQHIFPRRA